MDDDWNRIYLPLFHSQHSWMGMEPLHIGNFLRDFQPGNIKILKIIMVSKLQVLGNFFWELSLCLQKTKFHRAEKIFFICEKFTWIKSFLNWMFNTQTNLPPSDRTMQYNLCFDNLLGKNHMCCDVPENIEEEGYLQKTVSRRFLFSEGFEIM